MESLSSIPYPYLTFSNQIYADFMVGFMNSLETRFFVKNEIIAHELEECLEVIFVESGLYEIGYEINKK